MLTAVALLLWSPDGKGERAARPQLPRMVGKGSKLQALALLLLKVNAQGAGMAMVFFGCYALLKGYLILKSTFLPRILDLLGTAGQIVWPLVFGVNEQRWKEQAGRAAESIWA